MAFLKKFLPNLNAIVSYKYISRTLTHTTLLNNKAIASLEEVKQAKDNNKVLLIDVREPDELKETGTIPGSINIPLGDVETVLKNTTKDEFKKRYGRNKPELNDSIIFSCKLGKRSEMAQNIALMLGYKDIKNFQGGWEKWIEENK